MHPSFLVRGTIAVACAALASTAVFSPAVAAPAHGALAAGSVQPSLLGKSLLGTVAFGGTAMAPAIPSADAIAAAKKSEAATAAESARIDALLSSANDRLQDSLAGTVSANSAFTDALVALDRRRTEAQSARAMAEAAAKKYSNAKAHMGQLAGSLYKNGGLNLSLQAFLGSAASDDTMYQAATLMALSAERATTFDSAAAASSTSTALQAQAAEAQKAADQAAKAAEDSKRAAQSATDALTALVKENQAQREILLQQLATLHNTTAALEGARVDGLQRQAGEAALALQIRESATSPTPVAPPVAAPSRPLNAGNISAGSAPQHPAATTPAAPAQPSRPAPALPAPAQPAPAPAQPAPAPAPAQPTPSPAKPAGSYIQVMVNYAMAQSGKQYEWGGTGSPGFDCSGLVMKSFAAAGIAVPRTGTAQFWAAPQRVPLSQMRYGDLLVFNESAPGSGQFGHIAIYIGNNQVVQALSYGYPLGVYSLSSMALGGMHLYGSAARY